MAKKIKVTDDVTPVIVNNRPLVKDSAPVDNPETEANTGLITEKPLLKPLPGAPKLSKQLAEASAKLDDSEPAQASAPIKLEAPVKLIEPAKPPVPTALIEKVEEPVQPAAEDKVPPSAEEVEASEAAVQAERDAAVQKLIDDKQYQLPINALEKKRSRQFVTAGILLSLVLIVAWADVALDAGLIHLAGIKPVTHFFSN